MKNLIIRRIKMDDHPNRSDIRWLLFEQGEMTKPIICLSDYEMDCMIEQVEEQRANHEEKK